MNRFVTHAASASGSGISSSKIARLRSLLAFDRSQLEAIHSARTSALIPEGHPALAFNGLSSSDTCALSLRVVGFDEAGRGALAGPVTVACASFDLSQLFASCGDVREAVLETYADLNDSKQVTVRHRERLYSHILAEARCGIGCASAVEIDRLGIVGACRIAAQRAYRHLNLDADVGLFDRGLTLGEERGVEPIPSSMQLTRGDGKSFHIAAASILAKVHRDDVMQKLDAWASGYGLSAHKGYGTAAHFEAIVQRGTSKFHRQSFLTRL